MVCGFKNNCKVRKKRENTVVRQKNIKNEAFENLFCTFAVTNKLFLNGCNSKKLTIIVRD